MNDDWHDRLREHKGTLLALAAFVAMFTIYAANHPAGLNANVKAAYTRISPKGLPKQNEFTVQLQVFYF